MKTIISASRRTDIPAFHSEWFYEQVKKGEVQVPNPFNGKKYSVSLSPSDVGAIVFWSKNYAPALPVLNKISSRYQKRFLFHFTITGYEGDLKNILEPKTPSTEKAIDTLQKLAERFSKEKIFWRFDPVIFTEERSVQKRLKKFEKLVKKLSDYCARCYFSFIDMYTKVKRRFQDNNFEIFYPKMSSIFQFVKEMQKITKKYNLPLFTCCEPEIVQKTDVKKAHCIDSKYLSRIYNHIQFTTQLKPTREECGCYKSRDIGSYNTCKHNCLYCYANQ